MREAKGLPTAIPVRGSTLAGVVLAVRAASLREAMPATLDISGEVEDLRSEVLELRKDDDSVVVFRGENRVWVVQRIVDLGANGVVVAVWSPSGCPRSAALLQRLPQRGMWPIVAGVDAHTVPSLVADAGAVAVAVKAAWPVGWRKRRARDAEGDPINGVPAAPPTGELVVGSVFV